MQLYQVVRNVVKVKVNNFAFRHVWGSLLCFSSSIEGPLPSTLWCQCFPHLHLSSAQPRRLKGRGCKSTEPRNKPLSPSLSQSRLKDMPTHGHSNTSSNFFESLKTDLFMQRGVRLETLLGLDDTRLRGLAGFGGAGLLGENKLLDHYHLPISWTASSHLPHLPPQKRILLIIPKAVAEGCGSGVLQDAPGSAISWGGATAQAAKSCATAVVEHSGTEDGRVEAADLVVSFGGCERFGGDWR